MAAGLAMLGTAALLLLAMRQVHHARHVHVTHAPSKALPLKPPQCQLTQPRAPAGLTLEPPPCELRERPFVRSRHRRLGAFTTSPTPRTSCLRGYTREGRPRRGLSVPRR